MYEKVKSKQIKKPKCKTNQIKLNKSNNKKKINNFSLPPARSLSGRTTVGGVMSAVKAALLHPFMSLFSIS